MQVLPRFLRTSFNLESSGSRRRLVLVQGAVWFLAVVVVAWVLAGWFWNVAAPDPAPVSASEALSDYSAAARVIATHHLFGGTSSSDDSSDVDHAAPRFTLQGAMTASSGAVGFAILTEEGKSPLAAIEGETFQPGVTLLEVLPGQVRLKIEDRVETIEMMEPATQPAMEPTAAPARPPRPTLITRPMPAKP